MAKQRYVPVKAATLPYFTIRGTHSLTSAAYPPVQGA
jgi:hypothetical protein